MPWSNPVLPIRQERFPWRRAVPGTLLPFHLPARPPYVRESIPALHRAWS